jgi:hypothetical protein
MTSLAMIVMAGTFYRLRNVTKYLSKTQINDLMIKMGFQHSAKQEMPSIIPRPLNKSPG